MGSYVSVVQLYRRGMCSRAAAEDVGQDPERPSIRVEEDKSPNTQCCMREGTQSAARGEADPSNFRFRISGSPGHYAVASTRGHNFFDIDFCKVSFLVRRFFFLTISLGGKEGGGAGALS